MLRWVVQQGVTTVPKSSKEERIKENISIFDFELSEEEMKQISGLNKNRRFNNPNVYCEAGFNQYFAIHDI